MLPGEGAELPRKFRKTAVSRKGCPMAFPQKSRSQPNVPDIEKNHEISQIATGKRQIVKHGWWCATETGGIIKA